MEKPNTNIRELTRTEIEEYTEKLGEPKFRARQLWEWIWTKQAADFESMTNLSREFRQKLATDFSFPVLTIDTIQRSTDGTV